MARIRSIKPEFFTDEDLGRLSPCHRLTFEGLWCYADKEGRLKDRPGYLKTMTLPYDNIDFESILNDLCKNSTGRGKPFITRYSVNNDNYIQINNFKEHQRPHHTEKDSILPANTPIDNVLATVTPRINPEGKEAVLKEEGMVIGKGKRKRREYPANFERLWIIHPKGGKDAACKAMEKFFPDEEELARWVEKLEAYKKTVKWKEDISPNMSTWINQGYFDGEITNSGKETLEEQARRVSNAS